MSKLFMCKTKNNLYLTKTTNRDTSVVKFKDYMDKKYTYKLLEDMPLKGRMELRKSKNVKATLLGLESAVDEIIRNAHPDIKEDVTEKGLKIKKDFKQFVIKDSNIKLNDVTTVQNSKQLAEELNKFLDDVYVNKTHSWCDSRKANIKGTIIEGSFSWSINGGQILLNFKGTDTFVAKQYSIPYTNKNNRYYVDMRVLNDAIRDIYKLMEQKAYNRNMLNTYKPVFSYFTIEFMESGPSEQAYKFVARYKNKKITNIQDINKILKTADELYIDQHGNRSGYLKLYIDLVFTVGTQKYLYHGLRFDIGDGNNSVSNSDIQQVSKLISNELANPKQFSSVRSIDNVTTCNKDKLIQSSSNEALQKNIQTEIAAGKDPKQAAAIAYSVQKKNDSITYKQGDVIKAKLPSGHIESFTVFKDLGSEVQIKEKTNSGKFIIYRINKSQIVDSTMSTKNKVKKI